jgi:hypothetical protein
VKRIRLLGTAIAGLLILGGTTAVAATPHVTAAKSTTKKKTKQSRPTTVTTRLACKLTLTLQVASGEVDVTPAATAGAQYGRTTCAAPLGVGIERNTFTSDAGGTLSGRWQQYFNGGTLYGRYSLSPADSGPPTATSFTSVSYAGTIVVTAGTGTDKQATGAGSMKCSSADGVHYACTEHIKLTLPVTAG